MSQNALDVGAVIDRNPVSPLQRSVIVICTMLAFLDGFDAQAIGYVAPSIIKSWGIQTGALGPVFSAGLMGLMLGALTIAPLADRYGRRPIIIGSTIAFGIFSLLTATADSIATLWWMRFLTGVGLGACMPNIISLTSEYSPTRRRAFLVMVMFTGFTLGSLAAGLVSAWLISHYGWQSVFIAGGVLPLLMAPVAWMRLPESLSFLAAKGRDRDLIVKLLKRIEPALASSTDDLVLKKPESGPKASVAVLLRGGLARKTLLLWTVCFMSLLDIYLLVSWLPTAMSVSGVSMQAAIYAGVVLQVGGLVGAPILGYLLDKGGPRASMAPAYALSALCIALIGVFASSSTLLTMLVVFGAGLGVIGGQTAANATAAMVYDTSVRSTGVGCALGVGRIGSILGPLIAGLLLTAQVSIQNIFFLSAVPALIAAVAAFALVMDARAAPEPLLAADVKSS
jgi:AAHS family 4-hydroxybenzoate transporter-like MFS transporter